MGNRKERTKIAIEKGRMGQISPTCTQGLAKQHLFSSSSA